MSNQIVISSGAKVRELEGVITGASGILSSVPYGGANGVATLDSGGKVPVSQLPSSVVTYLGTWNAATNTPTLTNGTGDAGDMYICNVAGTVNFGAGPITFAVGDWVLYGSGIWQKSSGQNGTVTSVAASITGNSIGITGSPISTAGTLAFAFSGTNSQYINGEGNLTTFPSLTGYVPYTGATSDVDLGLYSLKTANLSLYDITNSAFGSIQLDSDIFNFNDTSGNPVATMNYDYFNINTIGGYSATLDASGLMASQEYSFPNNSGTIALISDIPSLTGYVPYTGATQTLDMGAWDVNARGIKINGTGGLGHIDYKHQSGIPTGSASSSTLYADTNGDFAWKNDHSYITTFNTHSNTADRIYTFPNSSGTIALTSNLTSYVPYTGATANVNLGNYNFDANEISGASIIAKLNGPSSSPFILKSGSSGYTYGNDAISLISSPNNTNTLIITSNISTVTKIAQIGLGSLTATRTYTLPDATGTLALLESAQTFSGTKTFTSNIIADGSILLKNNVTSYLTGYVNLGGILSGYGFSVGLPNGGTPLINQLIFNSSAAYNYTFPAATGTIALTSNLSSYVPYTGATTNVDLGSRDLTSNGLISNVGIKLSQSAAYSGATGYTIINGFASGIQIRANTTNILNLYFPSANNDYTFPNATGTIALTSNLSSYVPYTGATSSVNLGTNGLTSTLLTIAKNGSAVNGLLFEQAAGIGLGGAAYTTIGPVSTDGFGFYFGGATKSFYFSATNITSQRVFTLPDTTGTLALTSQIPTISGTTNYHAKFTGASTLGNSLIWDNGTNVGIGNTNTSYTLDVSGTGRFTTSAYFATASGNVGIGTTSPQSKLHVLNSSVGGSYYGQLTIEENGEAALQIKGTNYGSIYFSNATSAYQSGIVYNFSTNNLELRGSGNTTRMTITSAGNVGIGTSSPNGPLDVVGPLYGGLYTLSLYDNASVAADIGGGIYFGAKYNSTTYTGWAGILGRKDNATSGEYGGYMSFQTRTNGSAPAERMRIASNGQITNSNAPSADWGMIIKNANTGNGNSYGLKILAGNGSGDYAFQIGNAANTGSLFIVRGDGAIFTGLEVNSPYNLTSGSAANCFINTNGYLYRSTSSLKYKKNVQDYTKGLAEVLQLRPVTYESKNEEDAGVTYAGLIAEEVHELGLTEFVQYSADGTPDALAYQNMVALAFKAIQELSQQNQELNDRLTKAGL